MKYANRELPDVQARFRKGKGTRDQIPNICWNIEKAREFQEKKSASLTTLKVFYCVGHNKLWKIFKEREIPDHLACLLRNLYAGQETTVITGHGTTNWLQIGKGIYQIYQGCMSSPCLFNLYTEYIKRNAEMNEAQAGIKIAREISITSDMQMTPP